MSAIRPTDEVKQFLESKGFTGDESEPFTYTGYSGKDKKILIIDESFAFQDIGMLIEDCKISKAFDIAHELEKWIEGN